MQGPLLPRPRFWVEAAQQKKTHFTMLGEFFAFLVVYLLAGFAMRLLILIPTAIWVFSSQENLIQELTKLSDLQSVLNTMLDRLPDWLLYYSLFASFTYGLAAIVYCRRFEKRSLASMGLRKPGAGRELALGAAVGLAAVLAVVGIGTAAKGFRVGAGDVSDLPLLLLLLLVCAVRACSMELLFRGYLAASLSARLPVAFTVGASSLIAMMVSSEYSALSTLGFLNTLLMSVLLSVYVIKRGSLLGAFLIRTLWDFGLGFLFGFAAESEAAGPCLIPVQVIPSNAVLTGGVYGPEASICATIALLAALAVVFAWRAKDPAPIDPGPPESVQGPEL